MRQVLPADAPVRAWLLSPAAGVPEMAVLEICGVTGGVDRRTGRLCTTLQLRLPHAAATPVEEGGSGAVSAPGADVVPGEAEAVSCPSPLVHEGVACPWW